MNAIPQYKTPLPLIKFPLPILNDFRNNINSNPRLSMTQHNPIQARPARFRDLQ